MKLPPVGATLRAAYHRATDTLATALRLRDPLVPPNWLFADPDRVDGSRDAQEFIAVGRATVHWLIDFEGVRPTDRFLDVGCGIGRMAVPLTDYLQVGGYHGLEISREKVAYCRRTVGRKRPDFVFHHADVYSKYYNPDGRTTAAEYRFPFEDERFDIVLLSSVFTHMLPADMEHYLSEAARVLAPGGKSVISYWLSDGKKGPPFQSISDVCEIYNPEEPEHGVVYLERYVTDLYERHGLRIDRLLRGSDRRSPDSNPHSRQDVVIATRPGGEARPVRAGG